VRLEHEPGEPDLPATPGERNVVDPPRDQVGSDVDVKVVTAPNQRAS
jgi:hypothetical protein